MRSVHVSRASLRRLGMIFAAAITAAVTALASTGCVPGPGKPPPPGSPTSGNITWWGWTPTDAAVAKQYIAAFNKEYPNIHVTFRLVSIDSWDAALRPALASSSGPDVFDMEPGQRVERFKGFTEDLTPLAEDALGPAWKDKLAEIGVKGLTYDGKLTALSVGQTYAGSVWINPDLFAKYHLQPPRTMAEWKKVCKVFRSHDQGCFVQGAAGAGFNQDTLQAIADSIQPGIWTKASKGEVKWTHPVIIRTLQTWKDLFDSGIMQPGAIGYQQYPDANNDFLSGKYAMVMMGTWYMINSTRTGMQSSLSAAGVADPQPFAMQPIPFPRVDGSHHPSALFGDADYGLSVNIRSEHRAAAKTFVRWMTTSEQGQHAVADSLLDLPSLRSIQPDFDKITMVDDRQVPWIKSLVKQTSTVTEPRMSLVNQDVSTAMQASASAVATGQSTPQEAAQTLQQAAEAAAAVQR
ncbi:ABC transporter substrate-binding protein [Microlunatus soli]|uniref:ABC-type glycerol-3-phosphate transport system, substrate-binding protein n=1 Tax=Microlunatus soli TaxID=630515 RepID=A0A1H1T6I4_9ACTN|nr:extracellular solute-binding protein [Microlunatus soli]SDS55798.1 ABC-type glycerol-3-phosphate transport system, substrate-binding protein [Microlunatus soli]